MSETLSDNNALKVHRMITSQSASDLLEEVFESIHSSENRNFLLEILDNLDHYANTLNFEVGTT